MKPTRQGEHCSCVSTDHVSFLLESLPKPHVAMPVCSGTMLRTAHRLAATGGGGNRVGGRRRRRMPSRRVEFAGFPLMPSMPATIHALMRSPAVCTPAGIRDQARVAVSSRASGRCLARAARIHGLFRIPRNHDRAESRPPAHRRPHWSAACAEGVSLTTTPSASAWRKSSASWKTPMSGTIRSARSRSAASARCSTRPSTASAN